MRIIISDKYYVYVHRIPDYRQEDLYVGFGQGDRAYRIITNKRGIY